VLINGLLRTASSYSSGLTACVMFFTYRHPRFLYGNLYPILLRLF
jgi:hypothetical protein